MINEHGIDVDHFWRKVQTWAKEEAILRGREVLYREILRRWLSYIRP